MANLPQNGGIRKDTYILIHSQVAKDSQAAISLQAIADAPLEFYNFIKDLSTTYISSSYFVTASEWGATVIYNAEMFRSLALAFHLEGLGSPVEIEKHRTVQHCLDMILLDSLTFYEAIKDLEIAWISSPAYDPAIERQHLLQLEAIREWLLGNHLSEKSIAA